MKRKTPDTSSPDNPDKALRKRAVKKVKPRKRRMQIPEYCQHVPRPENFDIAGCGINMGNIDHLVFIPDFSDPNLTTEYMDKERVCKKCRKRYKLDEAVSKRRRSK
jgi:hypothetical protein